MAAGKIFKLTKKIVKQFQSELGYTTETIKKLSERRIAKALHKLELGDRPMARLEHERSALLDDRGKIPDNSLDRALRQVDTFRAKAPSASGEVANMPAGTTLFSVDARMEAPTAGLPAGNTGWTALGPGNIGGRTRAIVIDPANPARIFAASVGGGVWISHDSGASWSSTNDLMANLAVCSLVMDPTDANRLYAGTGEGFGNADAIRGAGIFRTTDAGSTWHQLAATGSNSDFFFVNALVISSDGTTLLAGTNSGIFRSTDSGQNWSRTHTGGIGNLSFDPADANRLIAGGLDNGQAYFSTDGGNSWQAASRPTSVSGRIQVCYAMANSATVYASVQASPSQIWRSTDGGQSYASRTASFDGEDANHLGAQGWYDNVIWAGDPTDANLLIAGGIDLWRSTDGGNTLSPISTWWSDDSAHADHHTVVSDPGYNGVGNRRVYFGNDGGIYRAQDVTTVGNNASEPYINGWEDLNNGYGVTQFYYGAGHIGTNTIMGGAQDNGTLRYTPAQGFEGWNEVWGGDGGDVASDPSDPQVWYGEYVFLEIFRDTSGGTSATFPDDYISGRYWDGGWKWKPQPFCIPDAKNGQAQFIAPFELDPNEPDRLLGGAMSLWRTNDAKTPNTTTGGPSWAAVKPPIGNSRWTHSITSIAIAHGNADIVMIGHANGNVYRSENATDNTPQWQRVDTNGINANRHCLALTIDPDDHDLVYAGFGGFQADNLWRTSDGGQHWTDISAGLPDAPIRDITTHPQRSSWVYLATQVGVFASEDRGANWSPTNEGPANVACRDFFWMGSRLVCVTHGRGMFEIDLAIADAFPAPVLAFTGTEDYSVEGNPFTRFKLTVTNRAAYPDSLFRLSPDLPPCGQNANASRTWVDIYNGDTHQRIYGFCAFRSADNLDQLWFALPRGEAPPKNVYIVMKDRRCAATYTSNSVAPSVAVVTPVITNPNPGATLTGDQLTFEWSAAGVPVSQWWLYVGAYPGGRNIYDSGSLGTQLFETVTGLPVDGSTIFVRLWYRTGGVWQFADHEFTAFTSGTPKITTPAVGAVLGGNIVTFEWASNGFPVSQWWLYVGSSQGGYNIYNSGSLGTQLFETVTGLPVDGSTIFVRLWYRSAGTWQFVDSAYTAHN
jgi:photosystem II stability/assembly factor-like uncharacterized protein